MCTFLKNKTFFFFSELRAQIQDFCELVCDKSAKLDRSFFDEILKTERKKIKKYPKPKLLLGLKINFLNENPDELR